MSRFSNEKELLQLVAEMRRSHMPVRSEVAARCALGISYANGRHWASVGTGTTGQVWVDVWDEDWDMHSSEVRVTDNKIGPLVRRIAADTNATRVEASVQPSPHDRDFEATDRAVVSQFILNSIAQDAGMTRVARNASSLRWQTGAALLYVHLSQKKRALPKSVLRHVDGSPVTINDKWVRWGHGLLSDLVWDTTNTSSDLDDHSILIHERVLTLTKFRQEFGDETAYGIETTDLPTVGELAPYYVDAAAIVGAALYQAYQQQSEGKGLRMITLYEADPRDPTVWPQMFHIIDLAPDSIADSIAKGKVLNFNNPVNPYGHHQRPIFKLDAFRRVDAVLPHGAPHVMMSDNDRLNILRSIQFQNLTTAIHGMWLLDRRAANKDAFANDLAHGVGGILEWDSRGGEVPAPEWITAKPPSQEFITMAAETNFGMQRQVHITDANLGVGKTHIPQKTQRDLLNESNAVLDTIIAADSDTYSDALTLTLGTIRKAMDGPNRMLARLRDRHNLKPEDLQVFLGVKPHNSSLIVRVRQHSILTRSITERTEQLNLALQATAITPRQYAIAMAEELERPIIAAHEEQLQFCHRSVRQIIAGEEWPGMPHLDLEIFIHSVEKAMWGLDLLKDDERKAIKSLQMAVLIQKQLDLENNTQPGIDSSTDGSLPSPEGQTGPDQRGGPPQSINPLTNPTGASGGLRLGLSA